MLMRLTRQVVFAVILLWLSSGFLLAQLIDYSRLEQIRRQRHQAQEEAERTGRRPQGKEESEYPEWLIIPPRVKNSTERRYDVNRDGRLQSAEVKVYLRNVLDQINRNGGMLIDSDVLSEYDKNRDGIIDREEAQEIRKLVR